MLRQFLLTILVSLIFLTILLYVFQRQLIYFPERDIPQRHNFGVSDMTSVTLQTKDNIKLMSWYKPPQDQQATVIYFHGNAGHIGYRTFLVRQLINAGFGVLLLEYRGYGGNEGSPSEQGLYEDGRAAWQYLMDKGTPPERIVLYGESLGTAVATKIAAEHPVCSVILQAPFTSLASVARYHYPWILIKPKDAFNSLERIKNIHAPLLIMYGTSDQVVPSSEGLTLFKQANEPKKLLEFEHHNHNDLWSIPGFTDKVIDFIKMHCSKTS